MIKTIVAIAIAFVTIVGCSDGTQQHIKGTVNLTQVKGLEDCTFYQFDPGGQFYVVSIVRCPNSTTSTTVDGKTPVTAVVIDGVEYIKK